MLPQFHKHGKLVRALKLRVRLCLFREDPGKTDYDWFAPALSHLYNLEWPNLDMNIATIDTVALVDQIKATLGALPKLKWLSLKEYCLFQPFDRIRFAALV